MNEVKAAPSRTAQSVDMPSAHVEHHHGHPSHVAHHFTDSEQQLDSAKMGMWIFLLTEILLFGGLFCAYTIYRNEHLEMFHSAHKMLNVGMGAFNTVVLITSSLTVALAIRAMQLGKRTQTIWLLAATLACAFIFLVIKYFEYEHKIHLGLLPGKFYHYDGSEGIIVGNNPHIFFSIYFGMTATHGLHVLFGIIAISIVLLQTIKGKFSAAYYTPIELVGLYWHLVDLIWIYLFPLLYLIG